MKTVAPHDSKELAQAVGLESSVDLVLMEYKAQLSQIAATAIKNSRLAMNEIVKRSGVARSKVSAIKNGAGSNQFDVSLLRPKFVPLAKRLIFLTSLPWEGRESGQIV